MASKYLIVIVAALMASVSYAGDPSVSVAKPGNFHINADWAYGCDNSHYCSAVALLEDGLGWDTWISVMIEREAGPEKLALLSIQLPQDLQQKYGLRPVLTLTTNKGASLVVKRDEKAGAIWRVQLDATIASQLAAASSILLSDSADGNDASTSLMGVTAALKHFDTVQGRAGGMTALVDRGGKPPSAVPNAPPVPTVVQPKHSSLQPFQPSDAQWEKIIEDTGCASELEFSAVGHPKSHRLDVATTLLEIPCGHGAYNRSTLYFTARKAGSGSQARMEFAPLVVEGYEEWKGGSSQNVMLTNSEYLADSGTLTEYSPSRGIGDCGSSQRLAWDGQKFRSIAAHVMKECRGSMDFIRIWTAKTERR